MKKLEEKLNANVVGGAANGHPLNSKGITLIALIITIIVMLILVGVTVNVAIQGGLFNTARQAVARTEEQLIYDQIVGAIKIASNGEINVKETYEAAKRVIEEEGKTLRLISPTSEDKITEGTTGIAFEVEGENGTYTYTITTEKIIIGKDSTINDFEITISRTNKTDVHGLVESVNLTITPTIPESWQNPEFTETEAVKYIAEEMGLTGVTTLEQLMVEIYNMYTQIDETGNPFYGNPTVDSFEKLSEELKDEIGTENNPTAKEIMIFMMNAFGAPYTTVEEWAADMYEYEAETKVLRVNGEEKNVGWSKHTVYGYVIEENGTYEIEMELDGKKSRQTVEITEIESMGTYVKYDSDSDGDLTDETLYIILYEEGELGEGYGAQIIPADVSKMEKFDYDSISIDETKLEQIDDEEAISDMEKAIYVNNNIVEILNEECEVLVSQREGITDGVRSLGSNPINPYEDNDEMFYKTSIPNYDETQNDWFAQFDGKIKHGNTGEPEDITKMQDKKLFVSERDIGGSSSTSILLPRRTEIEMNIETLSGVVIYGIIKPYLKIVNIGENDINLGDAQLLYVGYNGSTYYDIDTNFHTGRKLCPVISLVPGILDNATGKGTEKDPLILK